MCLSCKFFKFSKAGEVSCSISCHVCRGRHPRKCCCNWTRNRWERGGLVADSGDDPQTEGICKNRFYGILWCAGVVQVVPDVGGLEVVQTAETFFSTNAQSCSSRWFQYFKYNYKLHLQTFAKTVVKDGWNPNHAQLEVSGNFLRGVFFFFRREKFRRTSFWASSPLSCQWGSGFSLVDSHSEPQLLELPLSGFVHTAWEAFLIHTHRCGRQVTVEDFWWKFAVICCLIWLKKLLNCLAARTFVGMSSTLH